MTEPFNINGSQFKYDTRLLLSSIHQREECQALDETGLEPNGVFGLSYRLVRRQLLRKKSGIWQFDPFLWPNSAVRFGGIPDGGYIDFSSSEYCVMPLGEGEPISSFRMSSMESGQGDEPTNNNSKLVSEHAERSLTELTAEGAFTASYLTTGKKVLTASDGKINPLVQADIAFVPLTLPGYEGFVAAYGKILLFSPPLAEAINGGITHVAMDWDGIIKYAEQFHAAELHLPPVFQEDREPYSVF